MESARKLVYTEILKEDKKQEAQKLREFVE